MNEENFNQQENLALPNVFKFATSELSQDAMFAWLLQWADPKFKSKDKDLCDLGQNFVNLLTGISQNDIKKIDVKRQQNHIDIFTLINDDALLIIEDKTNTTRHSRQLERYKQTGEVIGKNEYLAYVKTGNEPKNALTKIANVGYKTVTRWDLLSLLRKYNGNHPLVVDYRTHLEAIEETTQSFRKCAIGEWSGWAWEGFYMALENEKGIDLDSWSYVPNPAGGFWGAWWHFRKFEDNVMVYLQFEEQNLCFKIGEIHKDRKAIREKYFKMLMNFVKGKNLGITRPDRFGNGNWMTIAVVDPKEVFGDLNKPVDLDFVVQNLRKYEAVIDELK